MMNLIIDVGNTAVKIAVFKKSIILHSLTTSFDEFLSSLDALLIQYPDISAGIISSVGRLKREDVENLHHKLHIMVLDHTTKVPFKNSYATPQTLGVDRLALISASILHYPSTNALVIDAGTCITYDFIDSWNVYHGGSISPGIRLRYQSLNNFTANLPLLEKKVPKSLIGDSTEEAIHSGVVIGVCKEIDGVIDAYRDKYSDLTVILTGGDSKFLSNQLKNSIFANSNFLLEGLNHILEFNSI